MQSLKPASCLTFAPLDIKVCRRQGCSGILIMTRQILIYSLRLRWLLDESAAVSCAPSLVVRDPANGRESVRTGKATIGSGETSDQLYASLCV